MAIHMLIKERTKSRKGREENGRKRDWLALWHG